LIKKEIMKKWLLILMIATVVVSFRTLTDDPVADQAAITQAIDKGIRLLQPSDRLFLENAGTCHSCHHQDLTAISMYQAREKGYEINDTIYNENIQSIYSTVRARRSTSAQYNDPVAIVMSGSYSTWALSEVNYPATRNIDLLVRNLMQRQTSNGSWVSPNPRPPLEYYAFTATALVVKAIRDYIPPALKEEAEKRIAKARSWMEQEIPDANEEKVFQLLGLTWAKGNEDVIKKQAMQLLSAQRPDGGWSQLDSLPTDAYATGQSLYALFESGQIQTTDLTYQKGINFLLRNQHEDGSWRVISRSFPSVPFVETGFPVGDHQFISAAASNWALLALLQASEGKGK
ncbi:MAG: hypothetical protein ACXWCR_15560, partial [Flavitalea sp.]